MFVLVLSLEFDFELRVFFGVVIVLTTGFVDFGWFACFWFGLGICVFVCFLCLFCGVLLCFEFWYLVVCVFCGLTFVWRLCDVVYVCVFDVVCCWLVLWYLWWL